MMEENARGCFVEYIKAFLTNNIVIAWIAPIFTAIIATIIIKVFSIRKKNKEIKAANQKYADAIRPYVIQKIEINEQIIHGIRNAISMEFSVPEKYICTDGDLSRQSRIRHAVQRVANSQNLHPEQGESKRIHLES